MVNAAKAFCVGKEKTLTAVWVSSGKRRMPSTWITRGGNGEISDGVPGLGY